jgi:hypothetical protein
VHLGGFVVREIVKVEDEFYKVHIPKEYINKKVEILVLPFDENDTINKNQKKMSAIAIDTSNFKFDRDEANER